MIEEYIIRRITKDLNMNLAQEQHEEEEIRVILNNYF